MRFLKSWALVMIPVVGMAIYGCGRSGGTSTTDPLASGTNSSAQPPATIFGNTSTATGKTGITLNTDRASVDVVNGQVTATAKVVRSGAPVAGAPVTFGIVAPANGPATIETGLTTVRTDTNGNAVTRITAGNTPTTTNVIISATVQIGTDTAIANSSFQIVRGGGVIMFLPTAGAQPGSQSNILDTVTHEVDPSLVPSWSFFQLIPFKVTDSNGNPRVGVPVTLSVYSISTGNPADVTIDFLVSLLSEPSRQTITTDSAGQGVFNARIDMVTPSAGGSNTVAAVYKAVTNDVLPVTAYVGGSYVLTAKAPSTTAILISPATASFGSSSTLQFTVTGGTPPYTVTSSNPDKIAAALQADGHTVQVTLLDPALWTGSVSFSVVDKDNNGTATTPAIIR